MPRLRSDHLDRLLDRAATVRVVVVGDVMLDVYLVGSVDRISPEAPVPVVHVGEERTALGGAANVAANVAALGARCDLIGGVGGDAEAAQIRAALARRTGAELRPRLVETPGRPTTTKTRVMARHQQVVRFDREWDRPYDAEQSAVLQGWVAECVAGADALVLEDYNKGALSPATARAALDAAAAAGIPSIVDPKERGFFEFAGATVFKPNAHELSAAMGTPVRPDDDSWLEEARRRVGARHLLLTLGEAGMALRCDGGTTLRLPAAAREVYDVSGAGDTVTAVLAVALAVGLPLAEAAKLANLAAGIEVGKPGVDIVTPEELRAALAHGTAPECNAASSTGFFT